MQYGFRLERALCALVLVAVLTLLSPAAFAADAGFTQFIASLWPEAQAAGVSRATFDAETTGLEPD
jgi:membrane-bound lytic murein transglycosylase B